ncbi:MAG: TetR/AcrR family transcriptional regulator [Bacillota bacterium]|nr:TetR/AcrR family transcriptional regulator [Bacillota bacterium]
MNGFEKRALQIKEKIMKATFEMLKTWDVNKIRIADIAKTAKVSQVTIYNYFGSKETLMREVFKYYINSSFKEFQEYMNGEHTFKEKIEWIILQERESSNTITPNMIDQLLINDPEIAKFLEKEYNEKIIPVFLEFIEEGRNNGEISNKISTQGLMMYINISMKYYQEFLKSIKESDNMDLINEMLHIFLYGICGKP